MRIPNDVELGNRITATAAAKMHRLTPASLWLAVEAGVVRGEIITTGTRRIRLVDPGELEEDLANLPECLYEGCTRRALAPSGTCSGPHARALETAGTKRPAETCHRISAGKKGKPRPDVRERVAAMHADREQHYSWGVALAEGRKLPPNSQRRWKGRLAGLQGGRPRGYTDLQAKAVLTLRHDEGLGFKRLAKRTGLSVDQVRAILSEFEG